MIIPLMNPTQPETFGRQLQQRAAEGLYRKLQLVESPQAARVTRAGRTFTCFASNNYLGLASHPQIIAAVQQAVEQWGWGSAASRLITGHMPPHAQLEQALAQFKQTESALVCSTGYQANLAAIRSLARSGDVVFLDKLNHASIIDGAFGSGATVRVFPHKDYRKLQRLLERTASARRRVIVTDTLFSMDGDFADLPRLVELKHRYQALLCVDEAHATGVWGASGRGVAEMAGTEAEIDLTVGTLSKALGGIGGFIAGSRELVEWVINTAGPFIYTTALPPAACGAAIAALQLVAREPARRTRLTTLAERLRARLTHAGIDVAASESQLIPVIVGDADRAVRWAAALEAEGLIVPAIRPPTVPRGRSRLRISLCSEHTDEEIQQLAHCLQWCHKKVK
jgi:8-amino-7-oxononanoate synthase